MVYQTGKCQKFWIISVQKIRWGFQIGKVWKNRDCIKNLKFRQFNLTPSVENSSPNTIDLNDIEDDQEDIPIGQIASLSANKNTKT